MLGRVSLVRLWFGSARPRFCLATFALITVMLLMYAGAIQASLSLGPGGNFPRFRDVFLYALSHDDLSSLLVSLILLVLLGPYQERCWGTVALLALSILTMIFLPFVYTLVLFVGGGEASRICGYSAVQLALVTAQCRQTTQRRLMRCLPVWFLPWLFLLVGLLLLPGTPALLHFCAICIGYTYHHPFIGTLQELEEARPFDFLPSWLYVPTSARFRLPTFATSQRSLPQFLMMEESVALPEAELLEQEMLRAGILASLQNAPEVGPDTKVEVPKSSVSSLRLQQLEKMGFPTEKAVVALAASKQLDGAISLLIEDSIGEQAVVVSKGKMLPLQST
ncbi:rhomboid domain-containing protein 3 [Kryptolebias marmoratus]|uniref:Rhomboid domain containing 3 n=1 Tax=Kryptolebias marmoratus TaxID=37003 RepID=A0A3Q3GJF6_KRYMA|nr:rhomboid domain-containing protein 3 [Kryptolebias marmoratus]